MKRTLIVLALMLTMVASASAMSYEQARREALFLTDKMAYELNLTSEQYDAAYEINLDYLMGVTGVDDVYSTYWTRRNLDLSYILLDWQWEAFRAATYFYRPLYWDAGYWHFGVYARYPRRGFYYFDRPTVYVSYRGGHGWHANGGRSFYYDRRDNFRQPQGQNIGLRDRYDRGDFRGARTASTGRNSSTRVTVNRGDINGNNSRGSFGGSRSTSTTTGTSRLGGTSRSSGTFGGNRSGVTTPSTSSSHSNGTFGNSRSTSTSSSSMGGASRSSGTFGGNRSSASSSSHPSVSAPSNGHGGGTFGGTRSSSSSSSSRGTFGGRR